MENLSLHELIAVNGGSEATYNAGHEIGDAIHDWVVDVVDWCVGFWHGLTGK